MPTLAELVTARRAVIDEFKSDLYNHREDDISGLNDAIEQTPVESKDDALAALDFIRDEATEPGQHLIHSIAAALRKFVEGAG